MHMVRVQLTWSSTETTTHSGRILDRWHSWTLPNLNKSSLRLHAERSESSSRQTTPSRTKSKSGCSIGGLCASQEVRVVCLSKNVGLSRRLSLLIPGFRGRKRRRQDASEGGQTFCAILYSYFIPEHFWFPCLFAAPYQTRTEAPFCIIDMGTYQHEPSHQHEPRLPAP